ncbi:MAG: helix-turn-helix domain-containing protein [Burkholderiales bacterium]
MTDFDARLRPKEVARVLGVSVDTLRRLTKSDPTFPAFIEITPRIRFVYARDLDAWLARRRLESLERRHVA